MGRSLACFPHWFVQMRICTMVGADLAHERKEELMVRTRLYALAFPVVLALVGLVSVVPVASAHTITPQAPKSEPPSGWCGSLPAGIQMISGTIGGWLSIPTTTVAVDPCTLDLLRRKGDPAYSGEQKY